MIGKVLSTSPQKIDKKGEPFRTITALVKIPIYDKTINVQEGHIYVFTLLGKHDFVKVTGVREIKYEV